LTDQSFRKTGFIVEVVTRRLGGILYPTHSHNVRVDELGVTVIKKDKSKKIQIWPWPSIETVIVRKSKK